MNEPNVEALTAAIEAFNAEFAPKHGFPPIGAEAAYRLAVYLAARGVLVPSALTEYDLSGMYPEPVPVVEYLERIAKGEP